jgi:benzil reductase ((S)-benzoin forming)
VPWPSARVIGISRRPVPGIDHLALDLADPDAWEAVGSSFARELAGFTGDRVVFVHAAGTLEPIGFAGEVESAAYLRNVVLNSAAPQALGHLFLTAAAVAGDARRHLVTITSGAARTVYPGWSSYGAAKAAVDQWTRVAGAEQDARFGAGAGVQVLAVAPGTVDTGMQALIRATPEADFPNRQKFLDLHREGKLVSAADVAAKMWQLLDAGLANGSVVDLRDLP